MAVLVGSSGRGAGTLVARVDSVCMQQGQSKQFAHLQPGTQNKKLMEITIVEILLKCTRKLGMHRYLHSPAYAFLPVLF